MRDMLTKIDEVLNDETEYTPEYLVAVRQKQYETALKRHARRVAQERWLLQGIELGAVEPVWIDGETWRYLTKAECDLWLDPNDAELWSEPTVEDLEDAESPEPSASDAHASDHEGGDSK